jgi:hypothetical protein
VALFEDDVDVDDEDDFAEKPVAVNDVATSEY